MVRLGKDIVKNTSFEQEAGAIFTDYKSKVYHLAVSMVHNDKDAEDIVQNTFMKVLKNLRYFRHQSNISTWIYRIAYNESLMYLRKKYRHFRLADRVASEAKKFPSGMFINWSKIPDKELLKKEQKARLGQAIRHLPIKYRMPLLLHYIEDMPLRQSAQILGISLSSLKSRLHRSIMMINTAAAEYLQDKKERQNEPREKECPIWVGLVYDYVKDNLNAETKKAFQNHIADCGGCTRFIDSYAKAVAVTEALECQDIPFALQGKLKSFLFEHNNNASLRFSQHLN